ncbi:MAG: D-glycero-beta-D-manno-heptose 1-phosphate adenylyltransferase [Planctomycetota bacterium]|nr:D-glycero-beta-D-manno-heptose 1-phosphate adenylyltransferase [Planctomycetota bacterium]
MSRPLSEVLGTLDAPRVLVVGDLVLDRYLTGVVERISPEAPIQVLRVEREEERLGCAGSVAQMLAVLGADTRLVGVVGDDAGAKRMHALAGAAGVQLEAIVDAGRRTAVKTRHLARSHSTDQQVLRVDEETLGPVAAACEAHLLQAVRRAIDGCRAVVVSDYGKGVLTDALLRSVIDLARTQGIPLIVDPKGADFTRYKGATCITPNRAEAQRATGIAVQDLASADAAGAVLLEQAGLEFALVTLDREGMYLKPRAGDGVHLPTTPREVFDVTGAGDMVVSVLGMALAAGASPIEAAALANVAAGLEVEHVGVVPITRDEIAARLAEGIEGLAAKHVNRADVAALAERHRAARRRLVFTNGCFDVLHAGHVRYLAEAKSHGDVLIVGLNSDASVQRLKGAGRPLNALADRIEVLSALAAVDHVVVFEEDTPTALVGQVLPDVLVKGKDYEGRVVEGREIVEGRGGRVILADLHPGRSTTGLVDRIRGA